MNENGTPSQAGPPRSQRSVTKAGYNPDTLYMCKKLLEKDATTY